MNSSRDSKSASVSPGKPMMNVVRNARRGIAARSQATSGIDRLARAGFLGPQIHPVVSRVLADQIDLADAFGYERANFREHRFGRTAPVFAAHLRDHAKTAGMIAALGNLHISRMGRR